MNYSLKKTVLFLFLLFLQVQVANASTCPGIFSLHKPDYKLSPYTGMTRQHWKDAAHIMLEGAFGYIKNLDDPMKFPKQHEITYPRNEGQVPTEKLEGLCRTLFVAAPLLREDPGLTLNNIIVADYYRNQIVRLFRPGNPSYISHRSRNGGPSQILVEFGALAISLTVAPDVLWEPLTSQQKDSLAALMISYGDGPTVDSNWKFFNVFVLSFFNDKGYKVNEKLLVQYLDKSLAHYRGEGWYHDSPAFDFYSMWAFQMYGAVWAEYYGKYYPAQAKQFMQQFADLKDYYPYLFDRDGKMIMWGRSIAYRFAAATPFPLMGFENDPTINYGWMRRIASGNIKQFFDHPEFLQDGVPSLGFYGPYEPAVQMYSCRASVYWSGKAFLGLLVPADNPFWTAVENEGAWEKELKKGNVYNKFSKGSEILITDYPNIGASEVRAWCHETVAGDWQKFRSTENYNRLAYNSAFLWQADGPKGEVAMNYVVKNKSGKWEALRLYTFKKYEDGVYYRDAVLETNKNIKFRLADITLPNGILRVDKIICTDSSLQKLDVRLGHYALPVLSREIKTRTLDKNGGTTGTMDNGEYQLGMIPLNKWGKLEYVKSTGLHPQSNASVVMNVSDVLETDKAGEKIYVTLQLWKKSGKNWTANELSPLKKVVVSEDRKSVEITFADKSRKVIRFD